MNPADTLLRHAIHFAVRVLKCAHKFYMFFLSLCEYVHYKFDVILTVHRR